MTAEQKNDSTAKILERAMNSLDHLCKDISSIRKDGILKVSLWHGRKNRDPRKRLLGYWDFNQRVSKLGDFITFLEFLNVLRHEFNIAAGGKNIDLCFIDDQTHHNASRQKFAKTQQFKENLRSLAITNNDIGTISHFHSNSEFRRFYLQNKKKYIRWPPTTTGSVFADTNTLEKLSLQKPPPRLSLPANLLREASAFYRQHCQAAKPIVINVRVAQDHSLRNSNMQEIKVFLQQIGHDPRFKVIIICSASEIPTDFRTLPNILFSKDYFTDIEQDLALIQTSYLSIFPSSGMACFAWFADVPFIQTGPHGYDRYTFPRHPGPFAFLQPHQRHFRNSLTAAWLQEEVEKLVGYLEQRQINNYKKWQATLS